MRAMGTITKGPEAFDFFCVVMGNYFNTYV